jgi:predicted MFS family arabinose efflux permease
LLLAFASTGLALASYIGRTPAIRDALNASVSQMGHVILSLSIGSVIGIPLCGRLVVRLGARTGIGCASILLGSGLLLAGLGCHQHSVVLVSLGLACCGAAFGFGEVAYNVEAAALEAELNRSVLPSVHAAFSAGSLSGAGAAAIAVTLHVSATVNLSVVAVLVFLAGGFVWRWVPAGTGRETAPDQPTRKRVWPPAAWKEKRTILIGLTLLGGAFAEGTANDWLPLSSQQGHHVSAATASAIYVVFAFAMMITRISGGRLVDRFGRAAVLRSMCGVAAGGMLLFIFGPALPAVFVGAALWGTGVALVFPLTVSAAGDDPVGAARRVSLVAGLGYAAFLIGPPCLGTAGQHFGLLHAFLPIVAGVLLAGLIAGAVRPVA